MLLVVASAIDSDAAALLPHFRRLEPLLLTPADLSLPGWRVLTERPCEGSFVAIGRQRDIREIEGVLTLLPAVFSQELLAIEASARVYAAQEMTAFLRYFLKSLHCPVLNAPTDGSLCGPLWRPERWLQVAASCGLLTDVWHRQTKNLVVDQNYKECIQVTLIGEHAIGDADADLQRKTKALARAASVGMLSARYRQTAAGPVFCAAEACPHLSGEGSARLVEEYMVARGALV